MAETPEEKCARRTAKRVAGVSALQRRGDVPPAPDPYDMGLSKRQLGGALPGIANRHDMENPPLSAISLGQWEKSMMAWRASLREALHEIRLLGAVEG